ncbi:hypothetical protein L1987_21450 [Smallanthus sonchifolius]|uniref:Uncharacterized protein n=1 Tax=Smallanthus sonchifolius TaxID=185202 RepID=A0ACB9IW52_9ASTR|nr:hypothetical protein L1987_21450 [Smallanthus sonchifolius]
MDILDEAGSCWVCLGYPVSIWTACLKEVVSAWTKVVGYGFGSGLGVIGGVWVAPPTPVLLPWLDEEFAGDGISLSCFFEMISIEREYGIKGFPTIKVFVPGKPPVDDQGAREAKPTAEFALQ